MACENRRLNLCLGGYIHNRRGHRLFCLGGGDVASIIRTRLHIKQIIRCQRLRTPRTRNNDISNLDILIIGKQRWIFQQVDIFQRDLIRVLRILFKYLIGLDIIFTAAHKVAFGGQNLNRNRLAQLRQILLGLIGQLEHLFRRQIHTDRIVLGQICRQYIQQYQRHNNQKGGCS